MLTLHHLNNSRSHRILWLLEELEVPYEIKMYLRTRSRSAPKALFAINPLGKSPVITDGDVTLAESGAIVEYIIAKYGKDKAQPSEEGFLDNLYFTHYAEGSLMALLVLKMFGKLDKEYIQPELKRHSQLLETHLTKVGARWFAGGEQLTSADYMMSFALEAFVVADPENAGPKVTEYVKRIRARPAYKRAISKGGEFAKL